MPASSCEMLDMYKLPTGDILKVKKKQTTSATHLSHIVYAVLFLIYQQKSVKMVHILHLTKCKITPLHNHQFSGKYLHRMPLTLCVMVWQTPCLKDDKLGKNSHIIFM